MNFAYEQLSLGIATEADADSISELRIEAYGRATGSVLRSVDFLRWNELDGQSTILDLQDNDAQMVASIRMSALNRVSRMAELFDISVSGSFDTPILAMDKMVTRQAYRRHHLGSFLRYFYLLAARKAKMKCVSFTVNNSASRVPFLAELGYRLELADLGARQGSVYDNDCDVLLAVLPETAYDNAIEISRRCLPCSPQSLHIMPELIDVIVERLQKQLELS